MTSDNPLQLSTFDPFGIYLTYKKRTLLGGIKADIKIVQKEMRFTMWRRLKRQNPTLKKYRLSVPKFQKAVRAYALENQEERMWSYFVLSALRWLTPLKRGGAIPMCPLCNLGLPNDLNHFLSCPGLELQHTFCYKNLLAMLSKKDIYIPMNLAGDSKDRFRIDILSNFGSPGAVAVSTKDRT